MTDTLQFLPLWAGEHSLGGEGRVYAFRNGYGASVVRFHDPESRVTSYGGEDGLWELAVIAIVDLAQLPGGAYGALVYDTPVTNDVLGHLTEDDLQLALRKVAELPTRTEKEDDDNDGT